MKRQNFVPGFVAGNTAPFMRMRNQCKPDYRLQVSRRRYGNTQSVCRQCFSMCSNENAETAKTCFGGLGNKLVFTSVATDDAKIGAAQVNIFNQRSESYRIKSEIIDYQSAYWLIFIHIYIDNWELTIYHFQTIA